LANPAPASDPDDLGEAPMSADGFSQLSHRPHRPHRRTTLYYRAHGVMITSDHFSVAGEHGEQYELAELTDIAQCRGDRHPGAVVGMIILGVEAVILAPLLGVVRVPVVWLLGAVALAIPAVVGLVCAQRWPARYELIGWYRGQQQILFTTRDSREFGQVSRALMRAMEARAEDQ
jgi:hypothetical protein